MKIDRKKWGLDQAWKLRDFGGLASWTFGAASVNIRSSQRLKVAGHVDAWVNIGFFVLLSVDRRAELERVEKQTVVE